MDNCPINFDELDSRHGVADISTTKILAKVLAIAALRRPDYIVSWNFKHMANADVRKVYGLVCQGEGLVSPKITTPAELLEEGGIS